jgi:cyanophycinase
MMQRLAFVASICAVVSAAASVAGSQTRGHLVLNGGGDKPRVVMEKFIELAGGRSASIVVFPTASGEKDTPRYYRSLFKTEYGCEDVFIAPVETRQDAEAAALVDRIDRAGGIFFAGGDQRRIISALRDTPVGDAVRRAYDRGATVGGTSAGTACQSPLMITGDGDFERITADNVVLWPGLGLFQGVVVDQHFVARSRHNRLIAVVLEHPELLGVGVDEATAVWVKPDNSFEVLGEGWVVVYDAAGATVHRRESDDDTVPLGVHGLVTHVLLPGEVFDLERRVPVRGPGVD